ncbi:MAG: HIT family protein [Flavobacteriales bacterium]
MSTLFSKIVKGEIEAFKILEDEKHLAFLDVFPLKPGHTLVIPKKEEDYIFDMPDEELAELMIFAKVVSKKLKKAFPCKKIGVAVIGLEVPHTHIHLIPLEKVSDINFENSKLKMESSELAEIASLISNA